jgi:hypothetical protein
MFLQIIRGRTSDAAGLRARFDEWQEKLKPQSVGYLGTTGGVADDGEVAISARFESEEAAKQNSDRPEQTQWWKETAKLFDGPPTFSDYTNVAVQRGGGSDDAGFVQVMQGRVKDVKRARELDEEFGDSVARPDYIGGLTGYKDDGEYTTIAYFTSEKEAREGESAEVPEEFKGVMEEWLSLMEGTTYIDLREPWMSSK